MLRTWGPASLLKSDSNTVVFLWNLWNFKEHPQTTTSALIYYVRTTRSACNLTCMMTRSTKYEVGIKEIYLIIYRITNGDVTSLQIREATSNISRTKQAF